MRSANPVYGSLALSVLASWILCAAFADGGAAQDRAPRANVPSATTSANTPFRVLAPGVEITIAPDRQEEETFSTHDIVEILRGIPNLEWKPKLTPESRTLREMATATVFRRDIWCLEITFKPVRMIWVDVPGDHGLMQRKLVWYLVYHVRNPGGHLRPAQKDDGTHAAQSFDAPVRFFPQFVLESHEFQKAYVDRIIPVAISAIQQKEDPRRGLLNSVEISSQPIPVSTDLVDKSVWGVATWEDVDPRVDYFSVAIQGLTNAYKWVDPPDAYVAGDPPGKGRQLLQKTLLLNFWRPGDEYVEDQRIIRYGIPGQVDYRWAYR
jgi:hypothetical protein